MSEFGRTAKENGNRGTDHGHANVMFAFGGAIRGGKVYGEWPGLAPEQLYENRDLALTTDFRDVLGELVVKHLGNGQLSGRFPGLHATEVPRADRGLKASTLHLFRTTPIIRASDACVFTAGKLRKVNLSQSRTMGLSAWPVSTSRGGLAPG